MPRPYGRPIDWKSVKWVAEDWEPGQPLTPPEKPAKTTRAKRPVKAKEQAKSQEKGLFN